MNTKFWEFSIIDVLNFCVGIATLAIAYKIFKNFDAKKMYVNKQLETVLSLVESINKTIITVSFKKKIPEDTLQQIGVSNRNGRAIVSMYPYSLFIISDVDNPSNYDNVLLYEKVIEVLPFLGYINNPLLPTQIARRLHEFYSPKLNYCPYFKASDKFVVLSATLADEETIGDVYEFPDSVSAFKSWNSFIQCSKDLKSEIENWLKKYGAEDINFNHMFQLPDLK